MPTLKLLFGTGKLWLLLVIPIPPLRTFYLIPYNLTWKVIYGVYGEIGDLLPGGQVWQGTAGQLLAVMDSGTLVLNQGAIHEDIDQNASGFVVLSDSDDPALVGFDDPTETLIISAPILQVEKISSALSV